MTNDLPFAVAVAIADVQAGIELWMWARKHQPSLTATVEYHLGTAGQMLRVRIEELDLTVRAYNGLKQLGIHLAGELACWSGHEIIRLQKSRATRLNDETIQEISRRLWVVCKLTLKGATPPAGESDD